jgi:hypothetical protein
VWGQGDELEEVMVVVLEVVGTIGVITNVYDDAPFDDSTSQFHLGKRSLTGRGFPSFVPTIILGGDNVRLGGDAGTRVGE